MKSASVRARRGRLAVLALLACGAFLGSGASSASAAPSIANTGTGCTSGQLAWLVSCTSTGEDGAQSNAKQLRVSVLVNGDATTFNSLASLLTDDDWDGNADPSTVRSATVMARPDIAGNDYPRSRGTLQYVNPNADGDTGINSGTFCVGATRRTSGEFMRLQPRDTAGLTGGTSSSGMRFTAAGQCTGAEDYAYLFSWDGAGVGFTCGTGNPSTKNTGNTTNFDPNREITPGTDVRFCYRGDDPDTSGDSDFQGIFYRLRNLRTGAIIGPTLSCPENGDNNIKGVTVDFPERGSWVVEAELRDGGGCGQQQNNGYWFPIGTANVNSSAAPTGTLTADADTGTAGVQRPQINGNVTAQAASLADAAADENDADDGGVQIVEWDLDGSTTDTAAAPDGFEATSIAGAGSDLGTIEEMVHDTQNESPGLHTIRMRLTDNGAMDAADTMRKRSGIITSTYLVDSEPVLTGPASASTAINTPVGIGLSATDDDNDTRTYSVQSGPSHGSGSFSPATGASTTYTYTPTTNYVGTDSITFRVDDGFGGSDTVTVPITVGPPDTQITASPPLTSGKSNDTTPSFSFNAFGASPVTFECRLIEPSVPSPSFSTCTSGITYPAKPDGAYTFEVRSKATNGGQLDPSPASFSWTIDATAPTIQIDNASKPANPTNVQTANFTFQAVAPNAEAGSFQCRLDGDAPGGTGWVSCGSGTSGSQSYTSSDLDAGSHTFEVRSTDATGNTSTVQSYTWVVDLTAPTVTIDNASKPPAFSNSANETFNFTANETVSFECRLDQGTLNDSGWVPCGATPATVGQKTYNGLSEGSHNFQVRGTDQAGNLSSPPPDSFTWTVDTIAPTVTIDPASEPADPTNSQSETFEFDSTETGDFECRLDGTGSTGWVACGDDTNTGSKSYDSTSLTEGTHKFEVRQTDPATNVSNVDSYTWEVDITAPTIQIGDRPNDPTNETSASFTFSAVAPNAEAGDFECKLDTPSTPGTFAGCGENATSGDQVYGGLNAEGVYTFTVKSTDDAGNTSDEKTYQWTIDLTPPFTSITQQPTDSDPGTNPDKSNDATPEFKFNSDAGSTFQCRITPPSGTPTAYQDCTDQGGGSGTYETPDLTGAGFGEGPYKFEVFATDTATNPGSAASHIWRFDQTPPVKTTLTGPTDPTNSPNATFNFTYDERGSFECKLDTDPYVPCDDPGPALSGSTSYTGLSEGNHSFRVKSTDSAGNESLESTYNWRTDYTAPTNTGLTGPAAATGFTNATSATFNFSFNETGSFSCKLDTNAPEACGSGTSGNKTYAGPLAQGAHTFTVISTDAANNPSTAATHNWVVDTTAPTVQITGGPSAPVATDDASFTFTAVDNPSPNSGTGPIATQCKLDGGAFVNCSSPVNYNDLDDGDHTVTVRGTDQAGNTHSDFRTWTVDTTPPDTNITADPGAANPAHEATFAFNSTEAGSTFECSLDNGPFQPCDSPKEYGGLSDGEHNFRVRATDPVGNVDPTPDSHDWTIAQQVLGESSQGPKVIPRSDDPNVKAHGRFRVGKVECPKGTGPCEVIKKKGKVRIGGNTYTVRVVLDELIGDGKNVAMFVVLPPGARQPLYETGTGVLTLKIVIRGENGVTTKVKKRMQLVSQDKSSL